MENNPVLTPIKRFWLLLKPDATEIRNIYIYAIFSGFIALSLPLGIQSIINLIQGGVINASWYVLIFLVISGVGLSGYMQIGQLKITENLQQKIFTRAAFEFAYRIPRVKLESIFRHYAPELMNRFFDVVSVQKGLSKILIDFSTASIQVLFGLILLSLYHPFFILFSFILIILVFTIFKLTARKGLETSIIESKNKYNVAHWLEELARTHITFKLAGKTDLPLNRVDEATGYYITSREKHFEILKQQYMLMVVFKVLIAAGLLVIGSVLVVQQKMNIGQFVASEIIIIMIMNSVEKLILSLESVYDVLTSLEKIGQVTDLEIEDFGGLKLDRSEKGFEIEVKDLYFSYPFSDREVLKGVNLEIAPSEKVLITGPNDIGKSTLLFLLAGLYKPKSGYIAYNKLPLGNLNLSSLRGSIGDCLMEELLFEGTLLENITIGRKSATFENVQWAIKNVGLESFIKTLPDGYNTKILSQGNKFSSGISDKLLIARSIADKPKVLLIKDSFGSLIKEEKDKIFSFLTTNNNWTIILASSDMSLVKYMDRVVNLADNNIE